MLEELTIDTIWTGSTAVLECGNGGLDFLLGNGILEWPWGALKWLQRFVLLVGKLLLEPVLDGSCFAFIRSHEVAISVMDNDGRVGFNERSCFAARNILRQSSVEVIHVVKCGAVE